MPIDLIILERLHANDPMLTQLNLSYQQLTLFDLQELAKLLAHNTHLKSLDISGNALGPNSGELLAQLPHLETLVAIHCQLGDAGASAFGQNTTLQSLVLTDNGITSEGIKPFAHHKTLTYIDLTGNQIMDEGAIILAQNTVLTSLVLCRNKINAKGAISLAKNEILTALNLNYNSIQAEGAAAFAQNTCLRSLLVAGNSIGTAGIVELAKNQVLTSLDVSYNMVNNEGAIKLAKHPQLTYLNLSYNQIGFEAASALANNQTLNTLIASYNQFGNGGAIAIVRHPALTQLDLTGNQIEFEGAHALSYSKKLISLKLSYNLLRDAGAITLAQNKVLSELLLSYNQIGDFGAIALAENTTLKVLNLNYNQISEKGRQVLRANRTLSTLIISHDQPPEFTAENLDTIFLLSDSFLCITSLQGIIQFFNPAFSRVLGYDSDELLCKSFLTLLHPDDRSAYEQLLPREEDRNYIAIINQVENRYRCKDGSYRLIHWSSQTKHNRTYAIGTDITEKKQFELDFKEAQEKHMWLLLQEAEAFGAQQTEFIAQLSHEVRNPLSATYGLMELLRDQAVTIETIVNDPQYRIPSATQEELVKKVSVMKGHFDEMATCLNYQTTILDDNLDLVRIREKKLILKRNPFDLIRTVQDVVHMLQAKATQKGLTINSKLPEKVLVKGDMMRFKQVLVNLIGNAIKFTSEGHIDIEFSSQASNADTILTQLNVTDTGIGLTPEEVTNLFQRFSQAVGSEYGGSGLGLYLMRQLINLMGGDISIISEKGKGSTFSISLSFENLTKEEIEHYLKEDKLLSPAIASPQIPLAKPRLLVVDDNEVNLKILGTQLTKAGYDCQFARNGQEALETNDKQEFDMILMDVLMPVMDGITAIYKIRKREQEKKIPQTPIIVLTANALERDRAEALAAGIEAYLTKPFKKEEVLAQIKKYIRTKPSHYMPFDSQSAIVALDVLKQQIPITFIYQQQNAKSVHVAGNFNSWLNAVNGIISGDCSAWEMHKDDNGFWRLTVQLTPGTYSFKYAIDGGERWENDPQYPQSLDHKNSIITVKSLSNIEILLDNIFKNRNQYERAFKDQQALLLQLNNPSLSDYQILNTYQSLTPNIEQYELKQQLYQKTLQLLILQRVFFQLQEQLLIQLEKPSTTVEIKKEKYAFFGNKKVSFTEMPVIGDGWCTLRAAGIDDPITGIQTLINHLNDPIIINCIRRAIENNYQASISLGEAFGITGQDREGDEISAKIKKFYHSCQTVDKSDQQQAYLTFLAYLERPEVQQAYLTAILKTGYADPNLAEACLALQGKRLAVLIDYNLAEGKLVNYAEENVDPDDPTIVCIVFHPNINPTLAHYNYLQPIAVEQVSSAEKISTYGYQQFGLLGKTASTSKPNSSDNNNEMTNFNP